MGFVLLQNLKYCRSLLHHYIQIHITIYQLLLTLMKGCTMKPLTTIDTNSEEILRSGRTRQQNYLSFLTGNAAMVKLKQQTYLKQAHREIRRVSWKSREENARLSPVGSSINFIITAN